MENKINSFTERTNTLRQEITEAIVNILQEHHLTELQLSKFPEKQPWVVWFDKRSFGYDSRVTKVAIYGKGISVEVYDEDCCCAETLYSDNYDLACTNIDWLCCILDSVNYTLALPKSEGVTTINGHTITWSYKEPGLSVLPKEDMEEIILQLTNGKTEGELCYYDENDVEFEGLWKIKKE